MFATGLSSSMISSRKAKRKKERKAKSSATDTSSYKKVHSASCDLLKNHRPYTFLLQYF